MYEGQGVQKISQATYLHFTILFTEITPIIINITDTITLI